MIVGVYIGHKTIGINQILYYSMFPWVGTPDIIKDSYNVKKVVEKSKKVYKMMLFAR